MHWRSDTLLGIKEWPQFNSSSDTAFILVPFPKNHFWLGIPETAETDPHPELLRNQEIHQDIKKKCQKWKKMQNM